MRSLLLSLFSCFFLTLNGQVFEQTKGHQKFKGFFNTYYDTAQDKIYLQVDQLEQDFLYVYSLSSGVGSNDIGLDRGQQIGRAHF